MIVQRQFSWIVIKNADECFKGKFINRFCASVILFSLFLIPVNTSNASDINLVNEIDVGPVYAVTYDDIDNDGNKEFIVVHSTEIDRTGINFCADKIVSIWNLSTNGDLSITPLFEITGSFTNGIKVFDLENDGVKEIGIYAFQDSRAGCYLDGGGYLQIFQQNQNGWNLLWEQFYRSMRFPENQFAVADCDNDGENELLVACSWSERKLLIYEYDSIQKTFTQSWVGYNGTDCNAVLVDDVDGDLENEIILAASCWSQYRIAILEHIDGTYSTTWSDKSHPIAFELIDLDGDDIKEIVTGHSTDGYYCSDPGPSYIIQAYGYRNGQYTSLDTSDAPIELAALSDRKDALNLAVGQSLYASSAKQVAVMTSILPNPDLIKYLYVVGVSDQGEFDDEPIMLEEFTGFEGMYGGSGIPAFYDVNQDGTNELLLFAHDLSLRIYSSDVNSPPVADAGDNQVIEANRMDGADGIMLDGSGSSDPDGDSLDFTWSGPFGIVTGVTATVNIDLGIYTVTLTVNDGELDNTDSTLIHIRDTTPPEVISIAVDKNTLWPPNHKMTPVTISLSAVDTCDANVECRIISITSNEPINESGDSNTEPDWEITGDLTANLRAERSGSGDDRIYTITVECVDDSDNALTANVTVTVPHDKGKGKK